MMYQDRFSGVHECYKQLRLEGIKFPDRDPNERLMMENLKGIDSPMFDFIEQNAGKVKPKDLDDVQKELIYKSDVQVVEVLEEEGKDEIVAFDENEDFRKYLRDDYDRTEFEVAKSTTMILEDMTRSAEYINDLRTEVVRDIYNTCRVARMRIAKIVEVRSFANKLNDMDSLLEVIDFLDKKLDAFRERYTHLKNKSIKKEAHSEPADPALSENSKEECEEEEEDINNFDLLDLGGDDPKPEKVEETKKIEKKKKEKKQDKDKGKDKHENLEEQDSKEKDEPKKIKKLIAPPSGARKINAGQKEEDTENNSNPIADLLDFN